MIGDRIPQGGGFPFSNGLVEVLKVPNLPGSLDVHTFHPTWSQLNGHNLPVWGSFNLQHQIRTKHSSHRHPQAWRVVTR